MRVLIVASRFPLPPWRGNQVRTLEWLHALRGAACGLVCPSPDASGDASRLTSDGIALWTYRMSPPARVAAVGSSIVTGRPAQEGLYATESARRAVAAALREHRPDVAIVQMVRCGWAVDQIRRDAPDNRCRVRRDRRHGAPLRACGAVRAGRPAASPQPGGATERTPGAAARRSGGPLDRRFEQGPRGSRRSGWSSRAGLRPGVRGVHGPRAGSPRAADRKPRLPSDGSGGPLVRPRGVARHLANACRTRAGCSPAPAPPRPCVGSPAGRGWRCTATWTTSAASWSRASVAIAPMASGSGVPMKVLEAWAAGLPVVAHPWTASGVEPAARDALRIAESAAEWRESIVELLSNPGAARELAERGREVWRQGYHPDRVADRLRAALREVAGEVG